MEWSLRVGRGGVSLVRLEWYSTDIPKVAKLRTCFQRSDRPSEDNQTDDD